ncbi:4'-phosphopantetheinyl transferase family protein [Streptomyces huasconensis]|uniref:4'-phosphopantetheinyl transferase family protein n=1 Tax=Streptomyces TaxID=1883 RepID=UPI0038B485A3
MGDAGATVLWGLTAGDARAAAHTALLHGAARLTGKPADAFRLTHEPGGRPRLTGPAAPPHVSVSHGRGIWAVALAAAGPVGVDVETVEAVRPVPALRLAERWLDAAGATWLRGVPPAARATAFLWLWTQKEAVGKARGQGLRDGGLRRPVPVPEHWPPPVRGALPALTPLAADPDLSCAALLADAPHAHVLALASAAPTAVELRAVPSTGGATARRVPPPCAGTAPAPPP